MNWLDTFLSNWAADLAESNAWMSTAVIITNLGIHNVTSKLILYIGLIRVMGSFGRAAVKTYFTSKRSKKTTA